MISYEVSLNRQTDMFTIVCGITRNLNVLHAKCQHSVTNLICLSISKVIKTKLERFLKLKLYEPTKTVINLIKNL